MYIALVTYRDQGAYHQKDVKNEDDLLIEFLVAKELKVEKAIWNDPNVIWEKYDLAIVKSPWDYFNLIEDFYNWLNEMTARGVRLLNPISTLRWNADKHYLQDIDEAGLNVTKTMFLKQGEELNLNRFFKQFDCEQIIVKPAVSGGSKHTFKVNYENTQEIEKQLIELLADEIFLVQPFLPEIESHGEWSFIFFDGAFSHAILKKVKPGDFRVQSMFGGTVHPQTPPENLLNVAKQYVHRFAKGCLYARVDGTIVNNEFVLMELELIEPFLFLESSAQSLENYYQALVRLTQPGHN